MGIEPDKIIEQSEKASALDKYFPALWEIFDYFVEDCEPKLRADFKKVGDLFDLATSKGWFDIKARKVIPTIKNTTPAIKGMRMLCPICNQGIPGPIKAYHAKPIPIEQMAPGNRPSCEIPKCKSMARWNVNNGNAICEKHFIALATQGIPVFIIAKSLLAENKKDERKQT